MSGEIVGAKIDAMIENVILSVLTFQFWKNVRRVLFLIAVFGAVYGVMHGVTDWMIWLDRRPKQLIAYKHLQPIVNAVKDCAVLIFYIISEVSLSVAVSLTAPFSVTGLIFFSGE